MLQSKYKLLLSQLCAKNKIHSSNINFRVKTIILQCLDQVDEGISTSPVDHVLERGISTLPARRMLDRGICTLPARRIVWTYYWMSRCFAVSLCLDLLDEGISTSPVDHVLDRGICTLPAWHIVWTHTIVTWPIDSSWPIDSVILAYNSWRDAVCLTSIY